MHVLAYRFFFSIFLNTVCFSASALPIGFGRTGGDLTYRELKSNNFYVYHDERTPHEAAAILNSLDAAKPIYDNWLGKPRKDPLPVVMSATTSNPSFANFIFDSIELQTMGQGGRDLAWHELAHNSTYAHLENWLGPAGAILQLMWMPSWFLEGLAEALSVSIGSDLQASIERYNALTGKWLSYNKLHRLYNGPFSFQGYASSGAFVAYILRRSDSKLFPKFLDSYSSQAMPWNWPLAAIPFTDTMPLDVLLRALVDENGPELYESYKKSAEAYWQKHTKGKLFSKEKPEHKSFSLTSSIEVRGNDVYKLSSDSGDIYESQLKFSGRWASSSKYLEEYDTDFASLTRIYSKKLKVVAHKVKSKSGIIGFEIVAKRGSSEDYVPIIERQGQLTSLHQTKRYIIWEETNTEQTSICLISKKAAFRKLKANESRKFHCPHTALQPTSVEIIGTSQAEAIAKILWIKEKQETLYGDRYKVTAWLPDRRKKIPVLLEERGDPLSVTMTGKDVWMLVGERTRRTLRRTNLKGQCKAVFYIADIPFSVHGLKDGSLVLPIYAGSDTPILKLTPEDLKGETECNTAEEHISPVLVALRRKEPIDLVSALKEASLHRTEDDQRIDQEQIASDIKLVASAAPLDQAIKEDTRIDRESKPPVWRPHPAFGVPWLDADSGGTTLGILSIPIVDHLQNETVRVHFGYGLGSRFPDAAISLVTTRYWPIFSFDFFRSQAWNGAYTDIETDALTNSYVDESGASFTSILPIYSWGTQLSFGWKNSHIKRYIGDERIREGTLNEIESEVSYGTSLGSFDWSLSGQSKVAPASLNENFDYDKVGASTTLSKDFSFLDSNWRIGVDGSRTRGKKRRNLQEYYQPLKTFIPGSGSGFNNLNFAIIDNGGLFSGRFGENQVRGRTSYTFPLISDLDILIRLFYISRLDFTAFFNYGGAWNGPSPKKDDLIGAHGYNTDFRFDIKGVNFSAGQGIGQVLGNPLEYYLTFSFDAIF